MTAMVERIEGMAARLETEPHLHRLGALFCETVLIETEAASVFVSFRDGRVARVTSGPSMKTPWRFALRSDEDALERFWQPLPEPGFHDIFGLVKIGRGRIEGDILVLVKNLRFFKEFMALGRLEGERQ